MTEGTNTGDIRAFWDKRAREFGEGGEATLREKYLRRLEIKTILRAIRQIHPVTVLDMGCGNGFATKVYARQFPQMRFVGVDFSEEMILQANRTPVPNCVFVAGDVLDPGSIPDGPYDMIITQRCLQNIPETQSQIRAIYNLIAKRSPGGVLCLIECSKDGVKLLQNWRRRLGRKPLDDVEPWHNNFVIDKSLIDGFGATVVHFSSSYMILTKLVHPKLAPLGYLFPSIGTFGYDKLYVIR